MDRANLDAVTLPFRVFAGMRSLRIRPGRPAGHAETARLRRGRVPRGKGVFAAGNHPPPDYDVYLGRENGSTWVGSHGYGSSFRILVADAGRPG